MLNYSRSEMKSGALNDLSGRWGTAIGAMLLAVYIPTMVASLPGMSFSFTYGMAMGAQAFGLAAVSYVLTMVLSFVATIFIIGPLTMGYYYFSLRISRGLEANATMPYRAFTSGVYGRVTLGFFMMYLFISLWSLLFVIPGIVKSFSYAMMPYIMMDNPDKTWKEAMRESQQMMQGHKWELFVLILSFFGWILLVAVTCGIAMIYVVPYMQQAEANFYRALKGEVLSVPRVIHYDQQM